MNRIALMGVLLIAACESREAKYDRLLQGKTIACLAVDGVKARTSDTAAIGAAERGCALATASLNKFIAGN